MLDRAYRVVLMNLAAGALFSGILASAAHAQQPKLSEAQAIELETRFENALVSHDAATLNSLLADNAVAVYATANVLTKKEFISEVVHSGKDLKWFRNFADDKRKVILIDGGAVVVAKGEKLLSASIVCLSTSAVSSSCSGAYSAIYLSTTWELTLKGWQIVFCQGTQALPELRPHDRAERPIN
jgi:hypothetical protein